MSVLTNTVPEINVMINKCSEIGARNDLEYKIRFWNISTKEREKKI